MSQDDSSLLDGERTPGSSTIAGNPKAFKMYKQRTLELQKMTERVDKVEKLLAANLESMDLQQRQYEAQIETLQKQNRDK